MKTLSEAALKALNEPIPALFFLLDFQFEDMPEPIRIAQTDLVSRGLRYAGLPISFDPNHDGDVLTVRGDVPVWVGKLITPLDRSDVTIGVVFETALDDVIHQWRAKFYVRHPDDESDIVGFLRLIPDPPETQKGRRPT